MSSGREPPEPEPRDSGLDTSQTSPDFYRRVFEQTRDAILVADDEGRYVVANSAACELLGRSRNEILGLDVHDLAPHLDREQVDTIWRNFLESGEMAGEWTIVRKDGTPRTVEFEAVANITPGRHASHLRDVTELRETERELRDTAALLSETSKLAKVGGWRLDAASKKVAWTEETFLIHDLPVTDEPPLDEAVRFYHPDDREVLQSALERALTQGERWDLELRLTTAKGRDIWTRSICTPVRRDGEIVELVGAFQDITDHKAIDETLRQAQKMEAVGQLTGGIAHDFNNELSIILMGAEMIRVGVPPEGKIGRYVGEIHDAAERAAKMTRQLLSFSRQAELRPAPMDLEGVVREFVATLDTLLPDDIVVRMESDLAPAPVVADRNAISQILLNLATNARDAMPEGGELTVSLFASRGGDIPVPDAKEEPEKEFVCLAVRDTGVGMDETTLARVYDPFFTTKPTGVGTGLGLAMTYGLVKQHKGYIAAQSQPGTGTVFQTYFPLGVDTPAAKRRAEAQSTTEAGTETLLLVEDEEPLRKVTREILQMNGYRVVVAVDGQHALQVFQENINEIELVISDAVMPNLGGLDMFRQMREVRADLPLVLTSGYTGQEHSMSLELPDGAHFLHKPYRIPSLLELIRRILDGG